MSLTRFFQYQALEKLINLTCEKAERIFRGQVCPLILSYQLQTVVDRLAEEQVRILRDDLSWRTFPKKHKLVMADPSPVPTKRHRPNPSSAGAVSVVKKVASGRASTPLPCRFVLQRNRQDDSLRAALQRPSQFGGSRFGKRPVNDLLVLSISSCRKDPGITFSPGAFVSLCPPSVPACIPSAAEIRPSCLPALSSSVVFHCPQKRRHEEDVDDRNMAHSSSRPIKRRKTQSGHVSIYK
ncbi:hypothetical protein CU097_005120 [Rhizopus azygosporus]|uniref:Uncharacterized protein n=1 Tax=Rhizopus azygosporus TaxID=86630 RepID=A0A367IW06_RHIAZ|nr:hypothetical protein CU097_005120 [Rhizopus azygosporus]